MLADGTQGLNAAPAALAMAQRWLSSLWGNRKVVLIAPFYDHYYTRLLQQLDDAGAKVVGIVCFSLNASVDFPTQAPTLELSSVIPDLQARAFEQMLRQPPLCLIRWLDDIDPDVQATIIASSFVDIGELCGRPVFGWRRDGWGDWENKTVSFGRLQALGIAVPRGVVLPADADPALAGRHAVDLCHGKGLVVSFEDLEGDRGGASTLRYFADARAFGFWQPPAAAGRLRITEFLAGMPASIIGLIWDGAVHLYDPIEIVTMIDGSNSRFTFCGTSTLWRPSAEVLADMRRVAVRVGETMHREDAYRGEFSIDGIIEEDRFVVTEVNARHASGLGLRHAWPEFPTELLARSIGEPDYAEGFDATAYMDAARARIRHSPSWSIWFPVATGTTFTVQEVHVPGCRASIALANNKTRARLTGLDPLPATTRLGDTVAALSRKIGAKQFSYPMAQI